MTVRELVEMLRVYPTFRLRGLILRRVITILTSLRGNCPEYLREFGYCRARLLDLVKAFATPLPVQKALELGPGHDLFPPGCSNLTDTVAKFLDQLTADDLVEIDQRIQKLLRRKFTALVHVCTTAANVLRIVEDEMQKKMEEYVAERLGATNAVKTFLAQYNEEQAAQGEITAAHAGAAPRLAPGADASGSAPGEMSIVSVPDESVAEDFRAMVRLALPSTELATGPSGDDIVFYRELAGLALTDLPQTGSEGRDAYEKMKSTENFTPHSRSDISEWQLPTEH